MKLAPGYAFSYDGKRWRSSTDDDWEHVVIDDTEIALSEPVGHRLIDGTRHSVFRLRGTDAYLAQMEHTARASEASERATARWTHVSFDVASDAQKFERLIRKRGSEIVSDLMGLVVTTNATGRDIEKVLVGNTWEEGYRVGANARKFDLVAEASRAESPGRCRLEWSEEGDFCTATGSKGVYRVLNVGDAFTLTVGSTYIGSFTTKEGAKGSAERHEASEGRMAAEAEENRPVVVTICPACGATQGNMHKGSCAFLIPTVRVAQCRTCGAKKGHRHLRSCATYRAEEAAERPHSAACEVGCEHSETSTGTSTEVRSPTSTKTSTEAFTAGNFTATVTGGAGKGATHVHIHAAREAGHLRWSARKKLAHGNVERKAPGGYLVYSAGKASKGRVWVASLNGALIGQYVSMDGAMKAAGAQHIMSQPPEVRVVSPEGHGRRVAPEYIGRREGKAEALVWHLQPAARTPGSLTAAGAKGQYLVERVKRPRGHGDKPWQLTLNETITVGFFPTKEAAKNRAQKHDRGAIGERAEERKGRGRSRPNPATRTAWKNSGIPWVVSLPTNEAARTFAEAIFPSTHLMGNYEGPYVKLIFDKDRPFVQQVIASGKFPGAVLGYADKDGYFNALLTNGGGDGLHRA